MLTWVGNRNVLRAPRYTVSGVALRLIRAAGIWILQPVTYCVRCDISPHCISGGGDMFHGVTRYIATGIILYLRGYIVPLYLGGVTYFRGDQIFQQVIYCIIG